MQKILWPQIHRNEKREKKAGQNKIEAEVWQRKQRKRIKENEGKICK